MDQLLKYEIFLGWLFGTILAVQKNKDKSAIDSIIVEKILYKIKETSMSAQCISECEHAIKYGEQ